MACTVEGCDRPIYVQARGLCQLHYGRWHHYGDANWQPPTRSERFWSKVAKSEDCWLWTGGITGAGYGIISWREDGRIKNVGAHRFAYEDVVGPIPDGLVLDHLCRVTACVRPDHLEPVTPSVNIRRGLGPSAENAKRTECVNGHALEGDNVWRYRGARVCVTSKRTCCVRLDVLAATSPPTRCGPTWSARSTAAQTAPWSGPSRRTWSASGSGSCVTSAWSA